MSLFTDASLVMIPSGIKDQKVYSVTPTDGSGDLTFSRASNATRVNSSGLVEKVRTNLITYSQDFTNAQWLAFNSTKTTGQTDPNGGTTAVKIDSTAVANSGIYQTKTASITTRTASLWMKGEVGGEVVEYGDATNRATATLTTSWVRYSFAATDASAFFVIYNQTSSPVVQTWYVAFAQYEDGDIATDYIATTSAAVSVGPVSGLPRLDYSGGASCPSLLLEPQRTNLALWSEQMDNASWIKLNGAVTANAAVSPDGYTNADKFIPNTTSGVHALRSNLFNQSATAAHSWFVKADGYSKVAVRESELVGNYASFNLVTGTLISTSQTGSIVNYGNGWYRLTLVDTTTGVNAQTSIVVLPDSYTTGDPIINWSGDGTKGLLAYGASVELGAYATSYIPTLSSAVTRVADAAYKTGISSLIGQTEGTMFVDVNLETVSTQTNDPVLFYLKGTNVETYIEIYQSGFISAVHYNSGIQCNIFVPSGLTAGRNKFAFTYKQNDFALYLNGVLLGTDTSGIVGAQSEFGFQYYNTVYNGQQKVNQALLFKTRLSNADLATLTTL